MTDNIIHLTRVLRWNRAVRAYQGRRGLSFISMFSGIEAASVAFGPLGWRALRFAEIEKFPAAVLAHHYPDVPNVGDMSKHDWSQYRGRVDIVCGGPPCQAFSVAGLRESLDDARGNLSLVYMKALHAIKPRNAIVENVPGWLSTKDNAFGCFLAGLVGASEPFIPTEPKPADGKFSRRWGWSAKERCHYIKWPRYGLVTGPQGRAAWAVKDAQYFTLAQRRERVIVVADFGNGADPAAVLFEPESVRRDSPPSRETGQGTSAAVAPSLTASGRGVERTGDTRGQDPVVAVFGIQGNMIGRHDNAGPGGSGISDNVSFTLTKCDVHGVAYAPPIARCVAMREGSSQDYESTTMVAVGVTGPISHALKAEGADASEDGTGRGTPIIAFSTKDYGADASTEIAPTLRAGGHTTSHANAGVMPAICQTVALRGREGGGTAELGGDLANALRASSGGGDKPHVLACGAVTTSAVRRLTPIECERLQGFPETRKTLYLEAWNHNYSDHQKNCANAETQNHKLQKPVSNAVESALMCNALGAERHSNASRPERVRRVGVHALINLERSDLLLSSPEKSNWSVSIAENLNSSLLPMPIEDFVRLIAHIFTIQEKITQTGGAALPANTTSSLPQRSGSLRSVRYGRESGASANGAGLFMREMDDFMKSTTLKAGCGIDTLELKLQTSLSFATNVISSCIPSITSQVSSFSLTIECVRGYTNIPWRNSHISPDGPRYKALGNSWAVPLFAWLGDRIQRFMPR